MRSAKVRWGMLTMPKRMIWTLLDQCVSSAGNFGITLVAARTLGIVQFSAFSIAFLTYVISLGVSYAVASEPFQVLYSNSHRTREARAAREGVLGLTLLLSVAMGGLLLALGATIGGVVQGPLMTLGMLLPGLLVQDLVRQISFAEAQPIRAATIDAIWLCTLLLALVLVPTFQLTSHSPVELLVLWGAGAWVSGFVGLLQMRITPRFRRIRPWLRESRKLSQSFLVDFVSMTGVAQLVTLLLPLIVGIAAVGALRGAQLIFGPFTVLISGLRALGVPEAARIAARGPAPLLRFTQTVGGGLLLTAVAYSGAVLLLPQGVGHFILGANWISSSSLLPFVALDMVGRAIALAPFISLRAIGIGHRILKARAVDAPATLVLGLGGALMAGVKGAAAGLGGANVLVAGAWWNQYLKANRDVTIASPLSHEKMTGQVDS